MAKAANLQRSGWRYSF